MNTHDLNQRMKQLGVLIEITSREHEVVFSFYRGDDCYQYVFTAESRDFPIIAVMKWALNSAEAYFELVDGGHLP